MSQLPPPLLLLPLLACAGRCGCFAGSHSVSAFEPGVLAVTGELRSLRVLLFIVD